MILGGCNLCYSLILILSHFFWSIQGVANYKESKDQKVRLVAGRISEVFITKDYACVNY